MNSAIDSPVCNGQGPVALLSGGSQEDEYDGPLGRQSPAIAREQASQKN